MGRKKNKNNSENIVGFTSLEKNKDKVKSFDDEFVDYDIIDDWMKEENVPESTFVPIDRDKEDKGVLEFQKTGNVEVMEELYLNRVQTLEIWASRYHYLSESSEDMFSELVAVFLKAVNGYKKRRKNNIKGKVVWTSTPFNTYLWYSIANYIRNLKSSKRAKKRRSVGYDGPLSSMVLSLDFQYKDREGSSTSLKDIVSEDLTLASHHDTEPLCLEETLKMMSGADPVVHNFLTKLCSGYSMASAVKSCKTINGRVRLDKKQIKKFRVSRRYNRMVSDLISNRHKIKDTFKLVNYHVDKSYLYYSIEMKKTDEADIVMKAVRALKKNRESYLKRISVK